MAKDGGDNVPERGDKAGAVDATASQGGMSPAELATAVLQDQVCRLSRESSQDERARSAEAAAFSLSLGTGLDGKLTPDMNAALRKDGAKVEQSPFVPDKENARYFESLKGLTTTTITFDLQQLGSAPCKDAAAKKVELKMQPSQAGYGQGQEVKIKPIELEAGKGMPESVELGVISNSPYRTVTTNPDGSKEHLQLGSKGNIERRITTNADQTHVVVNYMREGAERGHEIPESSVKYNKDGTQEITKFSNGVPQEKLTVKDNKLVDYNAYKDGKELSSKHPYSLAGWSAYKARETATAVADWGVNAPLRVEKLIQELRLMTTR